MKPSAAAQQTAIPPANKETEKMKPNATPSRPRKASFAVLATAIALLAGALGAAPAQAEFGLNSFDFSFTEPDATFGTQLSAATQAGSHPFAQTTSFRMNSHAEGGREFPDEEAKEVLFDLPPGFVGKPNVVPHCSTAEFLEIRLFENGCPTKTAIGFVVYSAANGGYVYNATAPVYSLPPAPGVPARFGFTAITVPIVVDVGVKQEPPYNLVAASRSIPQALAFFGAQLTLWGNPSDHAHDEFRGSCIFPYSISEGSEPPVFFSTGSCPVEIPEEPFLTMPARCDGPLQATATAESWQEPGKPVSATTSTHDFAEPPNPQGLTGCGKLNFTPRVESESTTKSAQTGSGLDFHVGFDDPGLTSSSGLAESQIKKAEITLPEGMTVNPSIGEGLGVCTPAQIARETIHSEPGEGCPQSSKIGTVHLQTPLIEEGIDGSVFLAQQDDPGTTEHGAENPFDSLIAFYIVLRNTNLGVLVKLPAKVEPDPRTGQLVTTLENVPQQPFSSFDFHFKEGQRAPLITPATCGEYTTK
ncbi:MAG TPA: hypothetical protein VFG58_03775, partial [Solirubrobacterales bacterium]|nr:hypothetical protein [Solirubrobacterales bacterium]